MSTLRPPVAPADARASHAGPVVRRMTGRVRWPHWVTYLSPSVARDRAGLVVGTEVHGFDESLLALLTSNGGLAAAVPAVWFDQPVFYFSNPAAIRGPGVTIPISPGSTRFDYEVGVAAVVGRRLRICRPTSCRATARGGGSTCGCARW